MKFKVGLVILLILIMTLLNSCSYGDINNELSQRSKELQNENNKEVESLNKTIEELNEQIAILTSKASNESTDKVTITEDMKQLMNFFNEFNASNIYHGMADSNIKIKVVLKEPLKSFPDDNAPYIKKSGELSYLKEDHETKNVEGELLYSTIDGNGKEWCYIIADGELGYIEEKQISEYKHQMHNYSPTEQFKDLRIGMTVEDVYNIFGDKVELIYPRLRYFRMLGVYDEYENEVVSFFYNPNTRIIDFIRVSSKKYELDSGYKIGDNITKVFGYYDRLYKEVEDMPFDFGKEHKLYDIGDGYWLELQGEDGILNEIIISPGYNIYT
ncbi:hypothetical protein AN1V17_25360 [Vallitalea sediminicola]